MEFKEVIEKRRSIRKYKNDIVDIDIIDNIINDALLSPSAHNHQPWHYYILTGKSKFDLEQLICNFLTINTELTYYQKIMRKNIEFIKEAPYLILCYIDNDNCKEHDILSMGSSIEHINLSAVDKGLSTAWIGVIVDFEDIINNYFQINNKKLLSAITIGYQDEYPDKRPRKEKNEVVTYL